MRKRGVAAFLPARLALPAAMSGTISMEALVRGRGPNRPPLQGCQVRRPDAQEHPHDARDGGRPDPAPVGHRGPAPRGSATSDRHCRVAA